MVFQKNLVEKKQEAYVERSQNFASCHVLEHFCYKNEKRYNASRIFGALCMLANVSDRPISVSLAGTINLLLLTY